MALDPSLVEVLEAWLYERMHDLHVAMPGKVKDYYPDTQTADIIPLIKGSFLKADGGRTDRELPVIPNVRVQWPRAGGCYLHFPMLAGDYVQLVFNEACIAGWRESGAVSPAGDLSRHDLSYPYAYPGGWPDSGAFTIPGSYGSPAFMHVASFFIFEKGLGGAQFVAGGEKVNDELNTIKTLIDTWATAMDAWLALLTADATTFAIAAPTGGPGVAALKTATIALKSALAAWPSATVEIEALKSE